MQQLADTISFVERVNHVSSADEVCNELLKITAPFGLDRMIAGTAPDPRLRPEEQKKYALLSGWPEDWMDRYTSQKFIGIDPIVNHLERTLNPFSWDEASATLERDAAGRRVMNEAGEFGLHGGYAIPLVTVDGTLALVSLGGSKVDVPPKASGMIMLAATYAIGRAIQISLAGQKRAEARLTDRETECIRWAAEGKSEWEISQILGISEHTSEKHLLSAKSKLGAVNRTQAVAEAIRRGYIT